jgi:very-short-patch-repair endonuclease
MSLVRLSRTHLAVHGITGAEYNERFGINPREVARKKLADKRSDGLADNDAITCAICGQTMKRITRTHLNTHAITTEQYKKIYGGNIVSDALAHKLGKASREMSDQRKQEVAETLRPYAIAPKSNDHRRKISAARKGKSWGNHTDEHKEYMRQVSAANMAKRIAEGWSPPKLTAEGRVRLGAKVSAKIRERLGNGWRPKSTKGMKFNLTPEQTAARSHRLAERIARGELPRTRGTSLEIQMMQYLCSSDIDYHEQYIISTDRGSWVYDFYVPALDLLLETDGEYYHAKSKFVVNRDKIKEKIARERGYNFLRISDRDWRPELIFAEEDVQRDHCMALVTSRLKRLIEGVN